MYKVVPVLNYLSTKQLTYMRSDNKVRELAPMCLLWQQWTQTSVSFDDVGISAFHNCVVVDLWQSLCFGDVHHSNAPAHTALSVRGAPKLI
jgi:hypothetical protein